MATFQSTQSVSRLRSSRVPANSSKPLASTASISSGSTTASASVGTAPTAQNTSTTSNISLFLTNLRLLDLDLLPDWPDISSHTFSTRDLGQGQKKRIQCVEWALFQLFAIWDREEARNKLQPFFPPLDHVQSLNLRAALLRALEQAKKNGVLGRDAVVRKTMLDECKGERLEEVLAVFSSAVLKKVVAEDRLNSGEHPAIAQTLALENRGYTGERNDLRALILAHRVSLAGILKDKHAARARYTDFAELLDLKQRSIARRREQAKESASESSKSGTEPLTEDDKRRLWSTVRHNWTGNEQWMEALLHGDASLQRDGVLTAPFDRVWRRVEANRLSELEDRSAGLLEQLESRVKTQRARLEQWQKYHAKMVSGAGEAVEKRSDSQKHPKGIDLGFKAHESLSIGRSSPRKLTIRNSATLGGEYLGMVTQLQDELAEIDRVPSNPLSALFGHSNRRQRVPSIDHLTVDPGADEEPISELSELDEEEPQPPPPVREDVETITRRTAAQPGPPRKAAGTTMSRNRTQYEEIEDVPRSPDRRRPLSLQKISPPPSPQSKSPPISPVRSPVRTPSPRRSPRKQITPQVSVQSPEQVLSPTQEMADQILASMNNTSPSPGKKPRHTLSLAERTRMSMARGSRSTTIDEDDEADFEALAIKRNTNAQAQSKASEDSKGEGEEYEDLVARTRRSMVGFEAARQKAQVERRRSQRRSRHMPSASYSRKESSSFYPVVEEADTSAMLTEELLMAGEEDAEAIFKSRPRIKTSPAPSPARAAWNDG